jgi:hypothetical protein
MMKNSIYRIPTAIEKTSSVQHPANTTYTCRTTQRTQHRILRNIKQCLKNSSSQRRLSSRLHRLRSSQSKHNQTMLPLSMSLRPHPLQLLKAQTKTTVTTRITVRALSEDLTSAVMLVKPKDNVLSKKQRTCGYVLFQH